MMPEIAFSCLFKRPSIITIHDLIPLIINERKKSFNLYFRLIMKIVINADHLIAVSNSTKRDLVKILKVPKTKISVIYEGVNHKKFYPLKKKRKKLLLDIKFSNERFESNVFIFQNKVALLTFSKDVLLGILIENENIAKHHKQVFEILWKSSKQIYN